MARDKDLTEAALQKIGMLVLLYDEVTDMNTRWQADSEFKAAHIKELEEKLAEYEDKDEEPDDDSDPA